MALDNNTVVNYTDKTTIKNWFKTGLKPTQKQFWSTGDSFWHKSESLPISSISGLGNLLDGKAEENHEHNQYAKNDATSLTADNVTAWQQKLGVADLKFDDKAITTTQDYADFGLQSGATINAFNNAIYQSVGNKLDAPTEEGTTTDYPYVVGVNDENEPIKLPAGDLGKNFSNTDLEITENRKHTGTASLELAMPMIYSNASQRFPGLVDKSADATCNALLGMDNAGNAGKLTALGNVLESGLQTITSAQALRIGQLLNGGQGSAGAMSVNLISPPIIQNTENAINYIVLKGANLNLNSNSFKIEILNASSNNVVLTIPNSSVQVYSDGLSLILYYNFFLFQTGEYKIRLTSGVKVYTTSLSLKIVENITNIDLPSITWEKLYAEGYTPSTQDITSGSSFSFNIKDGIGAALGVKSSEIFDSQEDFSIEFNIDFNSNKQSTSNGFLYLGVGYSDNANSLVNNSLVFTKMNKSGWDVGYYNNNTYLGKVVNNLNLNVTIVKTGNLFKINIGNNVQTVVLSNNKGYSFFMFFNRMVGTDYTLSGNIDKAFKIQ